MQFKLLKDILDWPAGYILNIEKDYGYLSWGNYGWEIPLNIIRKNPEWFEEIKQ